MLREVVLAVAIAGAPAAGLALTRPAVPLAASTFSLANQSVDSCYKKCFLDAKNSDRKFACRRACNASRKKRCEDKCWSAFRNEPKKRKACVSRCS